MIILLYVEFNVHLETVIFILENEQKAKEIEQI